MSRKIVIVLMIIFSLFFICIIGCQDTTETTTTIKVGSAKWLSNYLSGLEPKEEAYNVKMTDLSPDLSDICQILNKYSKINVNLDLSECKDLTSIGQNVFGQCKSLKQITLPNSITMIDFGAFQQSGLTSITIPDSVTSIGGYAFYACLSLTSVTISNSVTNILENAFMDCKALTALTIPNSVINVGKAAFYRCQNLTSVSISDNLNTENVGEDAFEDCGTPIYNTHTFFRFPKSYSEDEYTIPNGIKTIGRDAFRNNTNLTSISIPNSVELIESCAFEECEGLTEVVIPNSVTEIRSSAFESCGSLKHVQVGSGLKEFQSSVFAYCPQLKQINIYAITPPLLRDIVYHLFGGYNTSGKYVDYYTETKIYVPSASVTAYKEDWFWSKFSDIIYGM